MRFGNTEALGIGSTVRGSTVGKPAWLLLILAATGAVLSITACQSDVAARAVGPTAPASPSETTATTVAGDTTVPVQPQLSTGPTPGNGSAAGTTNAQGTNDPTRKPACPVTVGTLNNALKASTEPRFSRVVTYASLADPECYMNFASARSVPNNSDGQAARILFGYDPATQAWRPLNLGSADYCQGFVPPSMEHHFTGC